MFPLVLFFIVGFNLRSVTLAVPPVLPQIRLDLHLSYTASGLITALPLLVWAIASLPGAIVVMRIGARLTVTLALFALTLGAVVRVLPPEQAWIFAGTAVLSLGIAVAQPAMPLLVRTWFPRGLERVLSLYLLGLAFGSVVAAGATLWLTQFGGWRGTLVIWGAFAAVPTILWLRAPRVPVQDAAVTPVRRLLRDPVVLRVAALYGAQNLTYYAVATWVPFLLAGTSPLVIGLALFVMNLSAMPPMLVFSIVRWSYATSAPYYLAGGVLAAIGAVGFALGLTQWALVLALLIGLGTAMVAMGGLAAPAVIAASAGDVAAYSAIVLTIGQLMGFVGPLLGGVLVDHLHTLKAPFWLALGSALLIIVLASLAKSPPPLASEPRRFPSPASGGG